MDKLISPIPRAGAIPKAQGPLGQAAAMFFKNRGAVIGLALLVLIITASLAGRSCCAPIPSTSRARP